MFGAILGDIIGSVYKYRNIKHTDFEITNQKAAFTDDTVLTVATAYALLNKTSYSEAYRTFAGKYPSRGYGSRFCEWMLRGSEKAYNSFGNGSAMRVSPVAYFHNNLQDVLEEAKRNAEVTHKHPEGIKGAQAVAAAIFLARTGTVKADIRTYISDSFDYDIDFKLADIRSSYGHDVTCQGCVPQAIVAFLEADCFEDAVRRAISIGGDSDTIACITGSIAEAYYSIPIDLIKYAENKLDFYLLDIVRKFNTKFMPAN